MDGFTVFDLCYDYHRELVTAIGAGSVRHVDRLHRNPKTLPLAGRKFEHTKQSI
jgi:hypothetical protein